MAGSSNLGVVGDHGHRIGRAHVDLIRRPRPPRQRSGCHSGNRSCVAKVGAAIDDDGLVAKARARTEPVRWPPGPRPRLQGEAWPGRLSRTLASGQLATVPDTGSHQVAARAGATAASSSASPVEPVMVPSSWTRNAFAAIPPRRAGGDRTREVARRRQRDRYDDAALARGGIENLRPEKWLDEDVDRFAAGHADVPGLLVADAVRMTRLTPSRRARWISFERGAFHAAAADRTCQTAVRGAH